MQSTQRQHETMRETKEVTKRVFSTRTHIYDLTILKINPKNAIISCAMLLTNSKIEITFLRLIYKIRL